MVTLNSKTILVAGVLTITTSSQGLLTTASKSGGEYAYNFATVPFLAEVLKLLISCWLLRQQRQHDPEAAKVTRSRKQAALFLVPSLIYWLHNNVQFLTLKYVDPSTYQILGNLKIVTTGVLFWVWLRRHLSPLQWMALLLLMIGAATSQVKSDCKGDSLLQAPLTGYMFGVLSAFLSALAAVYTEWVMKRNDDSLYWQNMQLYSFGVVFNGMGLVLGNLSRGDGRWLPSIFQGYNFVTLLVVANLAFSGLLVSWVMKFADSILKVYATSMAMVVTMVVSVALFALVPSLQMLLGVATASISLVLYYTPPKMLQGEPQEAIILGPTKAALLPR